MPTTVRGHRVPGPKGHWLWGSSKELQADIIGTLEQSARDYGPIVRLETGLRRLGLGRTLYFLTEPTAIRQVLQEQQKNFRKSFGYRKLRALIGEGLLTSDGELWRRQRQLVQPLFQPRQLAEYLPLMQTVVQQTQQDWQACAQAGQAVEACASMNQLAFRIVVRSLFRSLAHFAEEPFAHALTVAGEHIYTRTRALIDLPWLPTPANLRCRSAMQHLHRTLDQLLASVPDVSATVLNESARSQPDGSATASSCPITSREHQTNNWFKSATAPLDKASQPSLVAALRSARHGREHLNETQLRDSALTFLTAGHETTAYTLAWAFFLLATHPDAQRRLQAEIRQLWLPSPRAYADLQRLTYTEWVILETLRLYPPAYLLAREPITTVELLGYPIPPGTVVMMSPYIMHRLPTYWQQPDCFLPERFAQLEGTATESASATGKSTPTAPTSSEANACRDRSSIYLPFGAGPRQCIGNHFAMLEAKLVLAELASAFAWQAIDPTPPGLRAYITLRPDRPFWLRLEPLATQATPAHNGC